MKLNLQVSRDKFYSKYYQAINGILKLTSKELAILENLSYRKFLGMTDKELFNSKTRSTVGSELSMSRFNFNNYIKAMADRGILVRSNKQLSINPAIYRDITDLLSVDFTFTFNIHESN